MTSATGSRIQLALDFAIAVPTGSEDPKELYPSIGTSPAVYGDHEPWNGASYSAFLAGTQPNYLPRPVVLLVAVNSTSDWLLILRFAQTGRLRHHGCSAHLLHLHLQCLRIPSPFVKARP